MEMNGPEKDAILLMSLGEEKAAQVLANMDEEEIRFLGNHMSTLGEIDTPVMDSVDRDFYNLVETGSRKVNTGGMDFLEFALMKTIDPVKASQILKNITSPGEEMSGGLETVRFLDPKVIASFIRKEHSQTAAIILAHLDGNAASQTLREIPEAQRMEIVHRLATLGRVSSRVIHDLDEALQKEFKKSTAVSGKKLGGVEMAAKLMASLDRTTETDILTSMKEVDPSMVDEIRNLRFTFEDILIIDDNGVQLVIKEVQNEDLLVSLKTATDELKEKLFSNMSERAAGMLKEDLESLGPMKISEVEKAQQNIIFVCKQMEENGKILIGGGEALV
jgi:flagellar motor switch protein FliG